MKRKTTGYHLLSIALILTGIAILFTFRIIGRYNSGSFFYPVIIVYSIVLILSTIRIVDYIASLIGGRLARKNFVPELVFLVFFLASVVLQIVIPVFAAGKLKSYELEKHSVQVEGTVVEVVSSSQTGKVSRDDVLVVRYQMNGKTYLGTIPSLSGLGFNKSVKLRVSERVPYICRFDDQQ